MASKNGSLLIATIAGIGVYVHWSWALVPVVLWTWGAPTGFDASPALLVAQIASVFGVVLLHEFGHALACRQVGGRADTILLTPIGGAAYVLPPARAGATLWSVSAGPLVNVVIGVLVGIPWALSESGAVAVSPALADYLRFLFVANGLLLAFNLLPIYPLDGGQMLYASLWVLLPREISLKIATSAGMVGGMGLVGLALLAGDMLGVMVAGWIALRSWGTFQYAGRAFRSAAPPGPRHLDVVCPGCAAHPVMGPYWRCTECDSRFDTFEYAAMCPGCGFEAPDTQCPECRRRFPWRSWRRLPVAGGTDWRV